MLIEVFSETYDECGFRQLTSYMKWSFIYLHLHVVDVFKQVLAILVGNASENLCRVLLHPSLSLEVGVVSFWLMCIIILPVLISTIPQNEESQKKILILFKIFLTSKTPEKNENF